MRKPLLSFLSALAAGAVFGFVSVRSDYQVRKNTAETDQQQGMYVFHQARPVSEYTVLGTVKAGIVASEKFEDCENNLLKKAKKQFPEADGILFDVNSFKADVIKFK